MICIPTSSGFVVCQPLHRFLFCDAEEGGPPGSLHRVTPKTPASECLFAVICAVSCAGVDGVAIFERPPGVKRVVSEAKQEVTKINRLAGTVSNKDSCRARSFSIRASPGKNGCRRANTPDQTKGDIQTSMISNSSELHVCCLVAGDAPCQCRPTVISSAASSMSLLFKSIYLIRIIIVLA